MRTLTSLLFSLSLLTSLSSKLTNWFPANTEEEINVISSSTNAIMMTDSVFIEDASIIEGSDTMVIDTLRFVVRRKLASTDFTVYYGIADDSTARGGGYLFRNGHTDFIPVWGSIDFEPTNNLADLTDTIKIPILQDQKTELDEYFKVRLTSISTTDLVVMGDSLAIGTIINDDTSYLSIRSAIISEEDAATDSLCFIVDMIGELDTQFTFNYITADSTATVMNLDFQLQGIGTGSGSGIGFGSGTGVGASTGIGLPTIFMGIDTIKIGILDDPIVEKNEFLKLLSSNIMAFGRSLFFENNDSLSVGTITNLDMAQIAIMDDTLFMERHTGRDTLKFVVTVDNPIDSLGIVYMTMDSTASAVTDTDFVAVVMDTLYMHGSTVDTIKIAINGDSLVELNEFLKVKLLEILPGDRMVSFSDSIGVGTIINDDIAKISIQNAMVMEGDGGTDTLKFIITASQLADSIGVVYTTMDSTAMAGSDYVALLDTIYLHNTLVDTIKIAAIGNDTVELDEFLKIQLTEILPGNRAVCFIDSLAIGGIINDDTAKVTIRDTMIIEGDTGRDTLKFVVFTDKIVDSLGLVFTTFDSTASAVTDTDYVAVINDTIYLNSLSVDTIKIVINSECQVELDEYLKVALTEILPGNRAVCFADSTAIGKIVNDDTAKIEVVDAMIVEGNSGIDSLKFAVNSSKIVDSLGLIYSTLDSTATTADNDYVAAIVDTIYISGLTDTIRIAVNGDTKVELDQFLKLNLTAILPGNRTVCFTDSTAVGSITNNDTAYVSIRDTMMIEGNSGIDSLCFIVDLSTAVDTTFGYDYVTMDSTATVADVDYVIETNHLDFSDLTDTICIVHNGDMKVELDEFIKLNLSAIQAGGRSVFFTDSLSVGTILNDDTTSISIRDTLLVEGNGGVDSLQFVITTDKLVDSLKVVFTSFDSTALVADNDYVMRMDTLCITGFTDTIKIAVQGDQKVELNEFIKVSLTEIIPNNRTVLFLDSVAVGTIVNDDTARITIRDTLIVEGDTGTKQLEFVVASDLEVDTMCLVYMTFDSTATTADNDYIMASDTLWTSGFGDTIRITVNGDNKVENNEFIKIALKEILPGDRAIFFADSLAIGTIENNDTAYIAIRDTMIVEGNAGTSALCFITSLTNPVDTAFGYMYATMDSTGTIADNDYVAVSTTGNFTELMDTLCVTINGDTKVELDNYFKLMLSNINAGTRPVFFSDSLAVGTIINDDTARLVINDVILAEGDVGFTNFIFNVTLNHDLDSALTVDFATCDSTATIVDNDYIANTGTLNFVGTANETQNITVSVIGDGIVEIDEIFSVKLSNIASRGLSVILGDSLGFGYIQNDDFDPTIVDPCNCLANETSAGAGDGQFSETVKVTSQTGETWYVASVTGLYQAPGGAFPPAKGGVNYPLVAFTTGAAGQQLTATNLGNGLSHYTLNGLHVDEVGYEITITNGVDVLSIGNLCHYEKACGADQKAAIPFFAGVDGEMTIKECTGDNQFVSDGQHTYSDVAARYNEMTICPNITGQILTVSFQAFDLAVGDTLAVYDGRDTTAAFIAKGSGNSISLINGGWVTSNCDPNINPSACLTFVFTTNGNNNAGSGWEAKVNCSLQGVTTLNRVDDVFGSAKCDSLKTPVNLRIPTINRSSSDCLLTNNDIIVTYCDVRDTLPAGLLTYPVFPFGTYDVTYRLLADTTITTSNKVHVSAPSLVCNDTVITTIGQGCLTMLRPDDVLERTCDTMGLGVNQFYSISVKTDSGVVVGMGPNYPILDARKGGNITCNNYYEVTVFRTLESTINGCSQRLIDSCTSVVQLIDGIKPVFVEIKDDTIFGCYDMTLTQDMLPAPIVIDNCEIDRLEAAIPPNLSSGCESGQTIIVTWTAYDLCGNSSTATQNIHIQRPTSFIIPKDTTLTCGAATNPAFTGWPRIDSNGDGIGDQTITETDPYCNFELVYKDQTIPGTCGSSSNILRIFTLFDDCKNVSEAIYVDTQYILLRDTIAPLVNCPTGGTLGSANNPYSFRTTYNACTALPGAITPPTGTDDCDTSLIATQTGVYNVATNVKVANHVDYLNPLEVGIYRIAYVLRDDCGNNSEVCNVYFRIADQTLPTAICSDELIVSLAYGSLMITAEDISDGSFDACGIDTLLIRRTLCGSSTEYDATINDYVAQQFGTDLDANGWNSAIEIGCCDMNTAIKVQLLIIDKGGNHNRCWLTISPENQPQSVCRDLPDAMGTCDDFETNYIGESTDLNDNKAFDDNEWQPVQESLLDALNSQFGSPACDATSTVCLNSNIEQEYQLIKEACGVQTMKRRFKTRNFDATPYPWYYQNITINYRPGWSFTFPADTTLQCGTTDVGNIPEMLLDINRGTCDQIGWEVKDQVFETEDGSCFKVLREWSVINACQHSNVQQPFLLPRDQFAGHVTANSKRTFTSDDVIFGTALNTQGYFTYTQVIIVMDNDAPIITIADVDTCIVGVADVAPIYEADVTPGVAPYECDTLRLFSATGMDCTASNQLDFSYQVFVGNSRINTGTGSSFYQVVQPNITYTIQFTASDNCGNIGTSERTFTFSDCRRPIASCQSVSLNFNTTGTVIVDAADINLNSYDNCTRTSDLDLRIWHAALNVGVPTNLTEVLALPTTVTLDCQYANNSSANLYVIDEAQLYSLCAADIIVTDNLDACGLARPMIAGTIQTITGDMVDQVAIEVTGTGEMPTMVTTDNSGTFSYEVEKGADYTITPTKDLNPLNGVSTFDLVLMQKHILGLKQFESPYHYIAADINQSKTITAYDMVVLRQLILNIVTDFPNNESWRFVNMAYPMGAPNPLLEGYEQTSNVTNIDTDITLEFMAVKVGDVNNSAKPNALIAGEDRNFNGSLDIHVVDQAIETGKSYVIDFKLNDLATIEGYQFTLAYEGLTFENWAGGLIGENYFGYKLAKRGFITTSWNQSGNVSTTEEETTFKLRFTAHETSLLSELLTINSAFTPAEGYNTDSELLDVQLVFDDAVIGNQAVELYQNRPNPFKEKTQVSFYLPQASQATLTILDVHGKVIKSIQGDYEKGEHSIVLNRQDIAGSGLFYYQLATAAGKVTKTMLILD